jgi:hypothetical protein
MRRERGQTTVESVALVLVAALALGGAAAAVSSHAESDHGLGQTIAKRIANAPGALDLKGTRPAAPPPAAPRAPAPAPRAPAPAPRAPAPAPRAPASPIRARAVDAFRRLRGVGRVAQRAWIVCLGYRRWRHELAHPRAPTQALPLADALAIVNECLNPYAFLFED